MLEVQRLLDDRDHDRADALRRQRELVALELDRLSAAARALDSSLAAHDDGTEWTTSSMFENFPDTDYED